MTSSRLKLIYLTEHLTKSEPQNPSILEFYVIQKCQLMVFEALADVKCLVGCPALLANLRLKPNGLRGTNTTVQSEEKRTLSK